MNYLKFNAPDVLFRPATQQYIYESVINPKVDKFLTIRDINRKNAIEIRGRVSITDINFKTISTKYFYNKLFKDVKTKGAKGFTWSTYYTITYDNKLAIKKCEDTGLFYNEVCLGKKPILFFIYFDLQEIFDTVRASAKR